MTANTKGSFSLKKWEWNGRPLAPPSTILRRLLAFPILRSAQAVAFIAILIGWGLYDAKHYWSHKD